MSRSRKNKSRKKRVAVSKIESFYKKSVERRRKRDSEKERDAAYELNNHNILRQPGDWHNFSNYFKNVKKLYKNNIDLIDEKGNTALMIDKLHWGYEYDNLLIKYFINEKANLNIQNQDGDTALHIAVRDRQSEQVALFLQSGADDTIKNNEGETAFEMAVRLNRPYANKNSWERAKEIYLNNNDLKTILSLYHYMSKSDFNDKVDDAPHIFKNILSYGTTTPKRDYLFINDNDDEIETILKSIADAYNALNIPIPYDNITMEVPYMLKFINPKLSKRGFEPILEKKDLYDVLKVANTENEYGQASARAWLYPYLRDGIYYADEM